MAIGEQGSSCSPSCSAHVLAPNMAQVPTNQADFPEAYQFLFEPSTYKVAYGGRAAGRSWSFARALLIIGMKRPLRVLCAREIQMSIRDSVHKLLSDQIGHMGLGAFYEIQRDVIKGPNGTEFIFEGIKHNTEKIKSMEGINICWLEEARRVSKESLDIIIPTILRNEDAEIWITFNPKLKKDEVYARYVQNKPANAIVVKTSWRDNPFLSKTALQTIEDARNSDPIAYAQVWEGNCIESVDGAIYAKEIADAREDDRIGRVPYDHAFPVHVVFDLGRADATAMWFVQVVGFEFRFVRYYENTAFVLQHYLDQISRSGFTIGTIYLPHDARAKQLGNPRTIQQQVMAFHPATQIVPKLSIEDGINAARTIFPNCWFDEVACDKGLECLGSYQYDVDDKGQRDQKPLHNWASHGADAFRYVAVGLRPRRDKPKLNLRTFADTAFGGAQNWMGR